MLAGVILGFVFHIFAILFQFLFNCSIRAKQGIMIGFFILLIVR